MKSRRDFLRNTFGLGAGLAAVPRLLGAQQESTVPGMNMEMDRKNHRASPAGRIISVETPDVRQLP